MSFTHSILQKFDSWDNWELYSKQLEQYFVANCVSNDEQVAILLAVLSPPVYRVLKESCRPILPRLKTYTQLSSELLKIYQSSQGSVFKERVKFFQARQSNEESVNEWLSRVISLAVSCEFGNQLDIMLTDNFVSGLADPKIVSKLCEKKDMASLKHLVDIAENMERSLDVQIPKKSLVLEQQSVQEKYGGARKQMSVCNILDIPDEILRKIILHLEAKERVPLGNSCERFNQLVFKDKVLLRDLDFSKNAHLSSEADILPYFEEKSTWKHILKINLSNVQCIEPGHMLNYSIGRANALVDINVHGIPFKDIRKLGSFLKPLLHLKRLSVDWPDTSEKDIPICCEVLNQPFNRLTYLSVKILVYPWASEFIYSLQLCQDLKELIIKNEMIKGNAPYHMLNTQPKDLRNLEIIEYKGPYSQQFKANFVTMLPDPEKWTDFQTKMSYLYDPKGFYLEKNVEVCEELLERKLLQSPPKHEWHHRNLGSVLILEDLLKEVLTITHENVPENFYCLSELTECVFKMEEAKRLLKNPRCQILYLCITHVIKPDDDVHLVASTFPNLTELVLFQKTTIDSPNTNKKHPMRRLRKRSSVVSEKKDDLWNTKLDSSFKMLVENTPCLRHITLRIRLNSSGKWDLTTLDLIPGWKNLEILYLVFTSINDYRETKIDARNFCKDVILSIEQLLHKCSQLTSFQCEIDSKYRTPNYDMLLSAVERLKSELSRPNLQIEVNYPKNWDYQYA